MAGARTEHEEWVSLANGLEPVLLLDFDGTVCLGDGPVLAFADAVIAELGHDNGHDLDGFAADLRTTLAHYLVGEPVDGVFLDGYDLVARVAGTVARRDQLDRAFRTSRTLLATGAVAVYSPPGLTEMLAELDGAASRVLVTNAPADGVGETLERLGLASGFDAVVTSAAKPDGWSTLLAHLLASRPASSLLSIGDVWRNDLAPLLTLGAATALLAPGTRDDEPAHATAPTLPDLYPAIREWVVDPARFVAEHAPTATINTQTSPGGPS